MTNNNKYAIYYLNDEGFDAKKISKELQLKITEVKEVLKNRETKQAEKIKTTSSKINSKNLMITETAGKGTKSVAIMTKAASEVNDEFKKNTNSTRSRTAKSAIFKPNK